MTTLLERLRDATNAHDAKRLAALFARDYRSVQRLYMEPAEADGGDIAAAVQELYNPPPTSSN
jgi:hypothetical protein